MVPMLAFDWSELIQQTIAGLANGGIYATLALALVLIHRATGVINFAQGEMAMFSAYMAWALVTHHGFGFWLALAASVVVSFFGGAGIYMTVIRPLSRAGDIAIVIATIAVLVIVNGVAGVDLDARSPDPPEPVPDRADHDRDGRDLTAVHRHHRRLGRLRVPRLLLLQIHAHRPVDACFGGATGDEPAARDPRDADARHRLGARSLARRGGRAR